MDRNDPMEISLSDGANDIASNSSESNSSRDKWKKAEMGTEQKRIMLSHSEIWRAIDKLANKYGMSPSGLARRSGLDPTTFNKSKRITKESKERWPSTESIAKILNATGATLPEFVRLVGDNDALMHAHKLPLLPLETAAEPGLFDGRGFPIGDDWDEVGFPQSSDADSFALEITGDAFEPLYRDGDLLIVSPVSIPRRGDRVVVKSRSDGIEIGCLVRESAKRIELTSLDGKETGMAIDLDDVDWVARIVWASQ
jgi:phage repressor protein C with HTH and peptisase S24 domain